MEAMATGRSVVTTDVAGAREGVGEAGAVVPVDDAAALSAAVMARLSDPVRTAAEGAAARRHIEREHDLSSTVGDVARLYDDLLAGS
jgi:glycosyltransferase involved in cell wall biosynthesis